MGILFADSDALFDMELRPYSRINIRDPAELDAWAEAFDVFAYHVRRAVMVVGTDATAVRKYLQAMGQVGIRSSSPMHDGT